MEDLIIVEEVLVPSTNITGCRVINTTTGITISSGFDLVLDVEHMEPIEDEL